MGSQVFAKVQLRKGDVINAEVDIKNVEIETKWGNLSLPIIDVSEIEFGIHFDKKLVSKIETLIDELAGGDEKRVEIAEKELFKGPIQVVAVLSELISQDKFEHLEFYYTTPQEILNSLLAKYDLKQNFLEKDVLSIENQYEIGGKVNLGTLALKTEFGDLSVPIDFVKKIEFSVFDEYASEKKFNLIAKKHIQANFESGWHKTGVFVKKGQSFSISSKGEIILASYSNYKYTPDGTAYPPGGNPYTIYSKDINVLQIGCPIFKIGESGVALNAYEKINHVAENNGMIYMSIFENVFNEANQGQYNVFIKLNN